MIFEKQEESCTINKAKSIKNSSVLFVVFVLELRHFKIILT